MTYVNLGNFIWEDLDGDGIQDVGEPGIANITVNLLKNGSILRTTTTSDNGYYSFSGLGYGSYSIQVVLPSGYAFTLKDQGGDDAKDSDVDPTTGKTGTYTFLSPTTNNTIDGGLFRPGCITGSVYVDANNNGVQDSGEAGIGGVTLTLSGINALGVIVPITVVTAGDGSYSFNNLRPGTYTVTETQPSGYLDGLDAKNGVVIPGSNTTDVISGITLTSGANLVANNFGERQSYSSLTPTLGFVSQTHYPTSSNYDPVTNPIVIQPIENPSLPPQYFILPEVGQSFIQTITLKNNGPTASNPNAAVTITAISSPFVQLKYVWNDVNNNNVLDSGETVIYANGQSSINFTPGSVAPGSSVYLKAYSTIVNADNSLTKENFSFQLQDDPSNPNDFGNATANTTLYLTQTGFSKQTGSTAFAFAAFAPSTLKVDVTGNSATQSATLPRAAGTLTEGAGGQTSGLTHFVGLTDFAGDADGFGSASGGTINSDPLTVSEFRVVWDVPPGADFSAFAANSGNSAFTNTNGTPNDSVIELFNSGYFSQAYADSSINKDGQTLNGVLQGSRGNQSVTQTALAGNIQQSPLQQIDYPPAGFKGTFDQFVSQYLTSPANATWQVNFKNTTSGQSSNPLSWSTYSWATNPDIAVIKLSNGFPSSQFYISMGNGGDNLDLSRTGIFLTNGTRIGANIDGGNGKDTIRGTSSNDTLAGGNGKDIFVFGINSGTDTITDFTTSGGSGNLDQLNLTELGINQANVLSQLDTNGNGVIDKNDKYAAGSTNSYLLLDLSSFSDKAAGLKVTSTQTTFNTNTAIKLLGVSSLTSSFFV